MPQTKSVSICIFVSVGSRYEVRSQAGISHFVEHMLFRGTERRPTSQDVSEAVERVGEFLMVGLTVRPQFIGAKLLVLI